MKALGNYPMEYLDNKIRHIHIKINIFFTLRLPSFPQNPICPSWNSGLFTGVIVIREQIVLVSGGEGDGTLREPLEGVARAVLAPELVCRQQLGPVLLGDQLLHLRPGHVDPVVEVPAPEHVVMGQNMTTLGKITNE